MVRVHALWLQPGQRESTVSTPNISLQPHTSYHSVTPRLELLWVILQQLRRHFRYCVVQHQHWCWLDIADLCTHRHTGLLVMPHALPLGPEGRLAGELTAARQLGHVADAAVPRFIQSVMHSCSSHSTWKHTCRGVSNGWGECIMRGARVTPCKSSGNTVDCVPGRPGLGKWHM